MYISVFMFKKRHFLDSVVTEGRVQFPLLECSVHKIMTHIKSHCSFSMPSATVPVFSKVVHFVNVYWNGSASLPAPKCSETATTNKKLLCCWWLCILHWNTKECFTSPGNWKDIKNLDILVGHWEKLHTTYCIQLRESTKKAKNRC